MRVKFKMDIQTSYGFMKEGQIFDCPSADNVAGWKKNKQVEVLDDNPTPAPGQPAQPLNLSNLDSLGHIPSDQPMPDAFKHVPEKRVIGGEDPKDSGKPTKAEVKEPKKAEAKDPKKS